MAGIYIHIPFCRQACTYCNFHFSVSLANKQAMVNAIAQEILLTKPYTTPAIIETIYIGGGTPSLLDETDLGVIFNAIHKKFTICDGAEITLEANPDDVNKVTVALWQSLGINRLSVGLQSFNEAELTWMNRAHNAAQSLQCLNDIQTAGFTNFSVDLIYGSPLLSNDNLKRNIAIIAERNIPHISCYALTVEDNTVLNKLIKDKKSPTISNEKQAEQFYILLKLMNAAGYEQYEISNFSQPNYRSKHNSSYWQGKPYYGFGPAAHSFNGQNNRRWNVANNSLYIQSITKNLIPFEEEILSHIQRLNEYVMIAVRTIEGIDLAHVKTMFGVENYTRIIAEAQPFITNKKLIQTNTTLFLTEQGKFFADGVAGALFA